MRTYWILMALMAAAFLGLFALVELLEVPLLTDPGPWLERGRPLAAAVGLGLLVGDVLLPVPASLVMVAHGSLFGFLPGTLLSLAGSVAAAAFGFSLGRRGSPWIARFVPEEERRKADALLLRWGDLAVIVSRPVPIVAESVAILAGTTSLGWRRFLAAAVAGCLPAAALYAISGALAVGMEGATLIFLLVLAIAGAFWLAGRHRSARS